MSFQPRTRLEKILCGVSGAADAARTRIEKAVAVAMTSIASAVELPPVTSGDNGYLLGVVLGKWTKVAPPTAAPYDLDGTLNTETGAITLAEIKASELYAVAAEGRLFKTTVTAGEIASVQIGGITAQHAGANYDFALILATGALYATGHLAADDSVVFSPVTAE